MKKIVAIVFMVTMWCLLGSVMIAHPYDDPCEPCENPLEDVPGTIKGGWPLAVSTYDIPYGACTYRVKYKVRDCILPPNTRVSQQIRIEGISVVGNCSPKVTDKGIMTDCQYLKAMQDFVSTILAEFLRKNPMGFSTTNETWKILMPSCFELWGGEFKSPIRIEAVDPYPQCAPHCCLHTIKVFFDECSVLRMRENTQPLSNGNCHNDLEYYQNRNSSIAVAPPPTRVFTGTMDIDHGCDFVYREGYVNCIPVCSIKLTDVPPPPPPPPPGRNDWR